MAGAVLTDDEREALNERAAIMEHDGKMTRKEAEQAAWREFLNGRAKTVSE